MDQNVLSRLTPEATVRQIVSADYNAASLLASIGMKPEQHKSQTLRSVCRQYRWNEEELLTWIKKSSSRKTQNDPEPGKPDSGNDVSGWLNYLSETIQPRISQLLHDIEADFPRVHQVHGNQYPRLKNMSQHFNNLKELLERHIIFERETLFPLASELNELEESVLYGKVKNLKRSIEVVKSDRPKISERMHKLREQADDFNIPDGACTTLRIMNKNFIDLFNTLETYFSLEQNRFFPLLKRQIDQL